MKLFKRLLISLLVACSLLLVIPVITPLFQDNYVTEAASIKISKTKITIGVGTTYKLKVKNTKKKVSWSSSNTKVAKVNKNGTVTAKRKGTAYIYAKVGKTTLKTKVVVNTTPILTYKVTKTKQVGKNYIIEGKVYNKTNSNLSHTEIRISLYDKNKKKIKTYQDSTWWLDSEGTWKFKLEIPVENKTVKSYKVTYLKGHYNEQPPNTYTNFNTTIKMKKTSLTSKSTNYKISGSIKNKTGKKISNIYVTYAFYDKNNNVIETKFGEYGSVSGSKKITYKNNVKFNYKETIELPSSLKAVKCKVVDIYGVK